MTDSLAIDSDAPDPDGGAAAPGTAPVIDAPAPNLGKKNPGKKNPGKRNPAKKKEKKGSRKDRSAEVDGSTRAPAPSESTVMATDPDRGAGEPADAAESGTPADAAESGTPADAAESGTPADASEPTGPVEPPFDVGDHPDELVLEMVGGPSLLEMSETLPVEATAPDGDDPGSGHGSDPSVDGSSGSVPISKKIAASASQLFIRRILVQVLSATSTAILARKLGVSGFGAYSAGLAMYYLALSACDFGFGNVLGRELGRGRGDDGSLVRSMLRTQTAWSAVVGLVVVGFSIAIGLDVVRIQVLIVLAPAVALFGLSGVRQVFYANYKVARLGALDVASNIAQVVVVVTVALAGGGPLAIAIAMSLMIMLNTLVVLVAGLRLVDQGSSTLEISKRMLKDALPLGVSSLLASAYFTLDLSIVGFIVSSKQVAYYAAATKSLSLLVTVPGLVVSAILPGMASKVGDASDLGKLVARAWHWLAAAALPLCMGVLLFAPLFVKIFYGRDFAPAVPLVRILALSGVAALLSNVFGAALIASRRTRWLIIQGSLALVFNVVGNVVLVPHFGVTASAWLTVATEVGIATGMALGLRGIIEFRWAVRVTLVPVAAMAAMVGVWALTDRWVIPSLIISGLAFVAVLVVLGGWPEEIPLPGAHRLVLWRRP